MKFKLLIPFFVFALAVFVSVCIFFGYTQNVFRAFEVKSLSGQDMINVNDVIENAKSFLADGSDSKLLASLRQYGYDLTLYGTDGEIIYDSSNKNSIGGREDINYILSAANRDKQIFMVNSENMGKRKSAIAVIDARAGKLSFDKLKQKMIVSIWCLCSIFVFLAVLLFISLYFYILRPFKKLECFAGEVAKGNLEIPLARRRFNLFGAFTWAFDMLRNELKSTRERENEAQRSKKELVAVLSHDIRTPIASIKAYAEYMRSLPDKNTERSLHYLDKIIEKTDEIAKLSNDMFLHAISDLEKLEITPLACQSRDLLNSIIEPLSLQCNSRITILSPIPDVLINTDPFRLTQVFENILLNAEKYAPGSTIEISSAIDGDMLKCYFRDYGNGVLPEDIPFIFDKFFRGKNAKESKQTGTGLGLYISKYILEKTGGRINASNCLENGKKGFLVEVSLKIIDKE